MLLVCDIAFSNFGWVAMDAGKPLACGVIETEKTKRKGILVSNDYYNRSAKLATELEEIINVFDIKGFLGELPSGGAKSSRAAIQMNMATGIVAALCTLKKLPAEFCTPNDVKRATMGALNATKPEIMDFIIEKFGGKKVKKIVKSKATGKNPTGKADQFTFHFAGQKFGAGNFEHIADAMGAWLFLKDNGNLAKIYG